MIVVIDEKMLLEKEIAKTRDDAERWRKETQLAKQQYEQYGRQMNDNVLQLSTKA
jgi:F0F1-type ATP synthase membrane subunit b/b'